MIGYRAKKKEPFEGIDLDNFDKDEYIARFDKISIPGIYVLVAVFKEMVRLKTAGGIILPDSAVNEDEEFESAVGLFIKQGNEAYVGSQFPSGPYANIGDWVQFNRGACIQATYDGLPYIITEAHKIRMIIDDPRKIGR